MQRRSWALHLDSLPASFPSSSTVWFVGALAACRFVSSADTVFCLQGGMFPELKKDPESIMEIINDEEAQFLKTLSRGRHVFQRAVEQLGDARVLPGSFFLPSLPFPSFLDSLDNVSHLSHKINCFAVGRDGLDGVISCLVFAFLAQNSF